MSQAAMATGKAQGSRLSRAALVWQALSSFVAVVVCYWVYWFVAVPLIEPNVEDRATASASDDQIEAARGDVNARQRAVAQYFGPDDWEMDHPAVSQIGQMRLLFKSLTAKPDGTVELRPCTLMFFPKDDAASARQRPVIMRAIEGANMRFDQPIVLKSVDLTKRKFVGGRLIGEIRIYRQASAPGAGDDLEITTREVEMLGERAWTGEPVNFRFGRSYGSGRDLEILLGARKDAQTGDVMRGASFRTLRLKRDVRVHLEMGSPPPDAATSQSQKLDEPPIEITCQGRFEFEIEEYLASFHNQVDVFRLNPEGESDQLNCQLLSVYFAKPGEAAAEPKSAEPPAGPVGASQVRMIEARGNPVTMRSPTQGMYARCKGVDYIPGAPGTPGSLAAFGPGVIHGNLPNDPAGKYVAQWARQLRFEPDGPMQRATLRGATMVKIGQMGTITADEVYAWLSQKPRPPRMPVAQVALREAAANQTAAGIDAAAWQIERVLARRYPDPAAQSQGDVVIESPQLHAVSATLEATIERGQPAVQEGAPGPTGDPQAPPRPAQPAPQNPGDRFEVSGSSVHIQLVPQGEDLAIAGATIERNAQLEQFAIVGPKQQRSLLVKGDQLRVTDANTEDTKVTITGNPGYVEAGGMTLWGGTIELEKRSNHLWINGPGRLTMPIAQDLDGQALALEQQLAIDWKKRMDFQTNTAVFEGMVVARSEQQMLKTEELEAVLTRAVEFGNPNAAVGGNKDARPELAQVRSHGPTFLEGRQMDEQGAQTSFSRMELSDLSIDRASGEIGGRGPGWVTHVTRGEGPQIGAPQTPSPPRVQPPADKPFTYLHVTFQKGIGGNINRRAVKFFDRTRTVYGPVGNWNARLDGNDLAALGPQGMTLDASELEVREMNRRPGGKRGFFELDASGGVNAEGQRFTAVGDRLTYAEQQDQLILRGSPAEMFLENKSGGQRHETRANEVRYWFTQHNVQVSGAQHLNISLPPEEQKKLLDDRRPQTPAAPPR